MKITTFIAILLLISGTTFAQKPEMVTVDGGLFIMGNAYSDNTDERPQRKVTLNTFQIGKFEVTNEEYTLFCKARSYPIPSGEPKSPVININWNDAVMYCNWLSDREMLDHCYTISRDSSKFYAKYDHTKNGYRLPTEAEWEYAAKGGNKTKHYAYSGSNDVEDVCVNSNSGGARLQIVGQMKPNELGIYDMTGNALEWCSDFYSKTYYGQKVNDNPTGPESSGTRVCRGGSFSYLTEKLGNTRRSSLEPVHVKGTGATNAGIRLARNQ